MFTCIGLFIQSIFMCQLFFICLVYILLCSLGLFNNWVGFLITQVYFIVFIEVLWLGVVYDEINIAVNTCKGLVLSKKRLFALNLSFLFNKTLTS
ncbi:hypothetical protein ACXQG3_001184, partial [Campylobacter coli]|nr:putative product [Campylobacter coli]QBF17660.1 hypothetical protein CCO2228_0723 [Campylobacter coli]QOP72033.1 hypothetical protein DSM104627_01039 [Campylobacter coli]